MKLTLSNSGLGKRLAGWLTAGILLLGGWASGAAGEGEKVSVNMGAIQVIDLPFVVQGFRVTDPSLVKAEAMGERQLRIMGLKAGATDMQVTGPNGESALFSITVIENIKEILNSLKKDLDAVPEVDLSINRDRVVLKGEISSIPNWETLQKVLKGYDAKQYLDLTTFRPAPEVMLGLKSALEKSGVKVLGEKDPPAPGAVSLKYTNSTVFINGTVFSAAEVARVQDVIAAQDWLLIRKAGESAKREAGETRVGAVINLRVEPVMVEVDVQYVGITDTQNEQLGVNLAKNGLLAVNTVTAGFYGGINKGGSGWGGNYAVRSNMAGVLNFMAKEGISRFRSAGHLTFKSGDAPQWRMFHSGGTIKAKIGGGNATATGGGNVAVGGSGTAAMEDIDYGLIIRVKGGLENATTTDLEVELELSAPELMDNGDYNLRRNRVTTNVSCPLGNTIILGGMKDLVESTATPSGVPFLRSIPVVQWFFSEKSSDTKKQEVLILLSAQLAPGFQTSKPLSDETRGVIDKAAKPTKERMKEEHKGRNYFYF
ncbi:MAG: pilus assembly protein N-terminal domain-containing protein [Lentisphaeria bacterium]